MEAIGLLFHARARACKELMPRHFLSLLSHSLRIVRNLELYAIKLKLGPGKFGIFDNLFNEAEPEFPLSGRIAKALGSAGSECCYSLPSSEKVRSCHHTPLKGSCNWTLKGAHRWQIQETAIVTGAFARNERDSSSVT